MLFDKGPFLFPHLVLREKWEEKLKESKNNILKNPFCIFYIIWH